MKLSEYLSKLFNELENNKIRTCVLRNYQGFPKRNIGRDIDLLVSKKDVESVIKVMVGIEDAPITSIMKRAHVCSIFIWGVESAANLNTIQIDLTSSLCFKGIEYLNTEDLLNSRIKIKAALSNIYKPQPYHEAINTFFSSYLVGGWINDKYQRSIIGSFISYEKLILDVLANVSSFDFAKKLHFMVVNDDREGLLNLLPIFRRKLLIKRFSEDFLNTLGNILNYYIIEVRIRYTPYPLFEACILGPDGAGKSTLINNLEKELVGVAKDIECIHLKPSLSENPSQTAVHESVIPYQKPPRNMVVSTFKLLWWVCLYWYKQIFHGCRETRFRLWDRYFYDAYIDPNRYRNGAPALVTKLIGMLAPEPNIVLVLDACPHIIQGRKKEVSTEETRMQIEAYLDFARESKLNVYLMDANDSVDNLVVSCLSVIVEEMSTNYRVGRTYR